MPRILIADDNSNIQRMAALALKEVGIEVVAVGNGEAAVRKLPEISPDLILADIFMPVRNGYEVCEYVKHDPKFANTPVLLLAGAFDPFDEREAQRVQADGILKKPFVPPDPLINAVKTLLEKSANERLMAATVPVQAEAAAKPAPTAPATAETTAPAAPPERDAEAEAYAEPLSVVDFLNNSKKEPAKDKAAPFASSLSFEVPVIEEPESVVTASRDPVLGEPAFWMPEETQRDTEEASADEEEPVEDLTDHTWGSASRPAPMREDPDPAMMLELEPPKPAAAVYDVDLTGVAPTLPQAAPALPEPAKEPAPESAKEWATEWAKESAKHSLAPELPSLEPFSSLSEAPLPEAANSTPPAAISEPHVEASAPAVSTPDAPGPAEPLTPPASTSVSQAADSAPAPAISARETTPSTPATFVAAPPTVAAISSVSASPSAGERTSAEDTLPLHEAPEPSVESSKFEMSPWGNSSLTEAEADAELPEAEFAPPASAPSTHEIPKAPANGATVESARPAPTEDEESSLLELEDSFAAFTKFFAPAPASRETEPGPAIEQKAAESEIAADWPPAFVPVTAPSVKESEKPDLHPRAERAAQSREMSEQVPAWQAPAAPVLVHREAAAENKPQITEAAAFTAPSAQPSEPAAVATLSPEAQETVIQRIIERMQPQIVELVTREILRPLVESLVRNELGK